MNDELRTKILKVLEAADEALVIAKWIVDLAHDALSELPR